MTDIIVVGAGVVGLLSALELKSRGLSVVLIDASGPRQPASWAGGGILSPLFPWRYPDAIVPLARDAAGHYAYWRDNILSVGGDDPELLGGGMLVLTDQIAEALSWGRRMSINLSVVDSALHIPWLAGRDAVWMPEIARIRNPRLLKGLRKLVQSSGIDCRLARVSSVATKAGHVELQTSQGVEHADRILVAAGAWASEMLPELLRSQMPIFPVRGQMLLYRAPEPFPESVLLSSAGYLIPRGDGLLLAGSTVEPGQYDLMPTESAFLHLRNMAETLWPALKGVMPLAQWAGIRPGSKNSLPLIGEIPDTGGRCWINGGHFRNGLVCAPASAALVADLICGRRPAIDPEPYSVSGSSSSPP